MKKENDGKYSARQVALMGLLFALAAVLSFLEGLLPVLPTLPPGVKLGLSNIVTMYTLFFLGAKSGFAIAFLKAFFVLLLRGPTAFCMSLSGGILSVLVMLVLLKLSEKPHITLVSIFGAVFHNIGQILVSALFLRTALAFGYLPIMVLSGVLMGFFTSVLFKVLRPYLIRMNHIVLHRNI